MNSSMTLYYLFYFLAAAVLALIVTPLIRLTARRTGILDIPKEPRKIHKTPTPLLGGLAVYTTFLLCVLAYMNFGHPDYSVVPKKFFEAILGGGAVLMIGGFLDDKYVLKPKILWLFPAIASLIVVLSGIGVGIKFISNPFGNPINIGFMVFGIPFSYFAMWIWMMGMTFTTKFLDGIDGLCGGITLIASLTIFALSLTERINQPITATLSIILAGAFLGYLVYAFYPATIFLGEGGSTFAGFMIGVLSIILGGKIATALIVMGIPILDIAWAIVRRLWYGQSPFKGDRKHLHHRLLDIGLSQRQAVLVLYAISAIFGFSAVFLQSLGKLITLLILFCVMLALAIAVVVIYKHQHPRLPEPSDPTA